MTIFVYEYVTALGASRGATPPLAPSLLREGRAMLDAVVADFRAIPDCTIWTLPTDDKAEFRLLAGRADFTLVVAPEFDGILETRCRWVEEAGGRLLGPTSAAVRLTSDKFALNRHFQRHGIPTPRTWLQGDEPDLFPIVWKPRDGAGSLDTYLLNSAAERPLAERPPREMIVQEFVDGFPASVALLIGPRESVALQPCSQRLSNDGRFQYLGGSTPIPAELAERAVALSRRAIACIDGLAGYVGIDLVLGEKAADDRVIEINPRLTTSYIGLRQSADFNVAEVMVRVIRGEPLPELRWHDEVVEFSTIDVSKQEHP